MLEGFLGTILLIILIFMALQHLGLLDAGDAFGLIIEYVVSVVALLAAFFFWLARRLVAAARPAAATQDPQVPPADDRAAPRRGKIETRTMARRARPE